MQQGKRLREGSGQSAGTATIGSPDYQALVAAADLPAYEQFMTQHLMDLPGLARLQSRFAMKTLKTDPPTADPPTRL